MSVESIPPRVRTPHVSARQAIGELQRRRVPIGTDAAAVANGDPFPGFSADGTPADGDIAAIWEAQLAHSFTAALISSPTSGGGSAVFDLELNGGVVLTLTLAGGETRHLYTAVFSVVPGDRLGGTLTAAGLRVAPSIRLFETT